MYRSTSKDLAIGSLLLCVALLIAVLIYFAAAAFTASPEQSVLAIAGLLTVLLALPVGAYLIWSRQSADAARLGLIVLVTICVLLVAIYAYWASSAVFFPADLLSFSESGFVADIIKLRVGYPLYSAEVNNNSYEYTPGAQVLTYVLSVLLGNASSIPLYRLIQVGYTLLSAGVAFYGTQRLIVLSQGDKQLARRSWWGGYWLPLFVLIAANSLTNPYVLVLHNDALAQLVSIVAYVLLLEYSASRSWRTLALMALIPIAGFLVKQNLAIWAPIYCAYLAIFDRPRTMKRLLGFGAFAFGGIVIAIAVCYLLWGNSFIYWTFTVQPRTGVSLLRIFNHILSVWPYLAIGLLSAHYLIRGRVFDRLLGVWLVWLCLVLVEAYTSGLAWTLSHMGPASLIAGAWFVAALVRQWPSARRSLARVQGRQRWLHVGVHVAALALLFSGLGLIRIPVRSVPNEATQYVSAIEKQFDEQPAATILLDIGDWIYLRTGVVMNDRAVAFGDRGYSGIGDFSGFAGRLRQRYYSKILVRNLHAPDFWYDDWIWSKSSGIRQIMLANYHEIGSIPGVPGQSSAGFLSYEFSEISVLMPNSN